MIYAFGYSIQRSLWLTVLPFHGKLSLAYFKERYMLMFENFDWIMFIGQALGVVAVILGFVTYQMKSPKWLLIVNLITCGVFCAHYLLIGAISGAVMNGIGIIRNVVYTNRDKKIFSHKAWPFIFAVIMVVAGLVTWQDWRSILMVCALFINSLALSMKNAQHIRWSLLITCPLVLIYDVLLHSYGGMVYEGMSIVSAIIGIVRFRKTGIETA